MKSLRAIVCLVAVLLLVGLLAFQAVAERPQAREIRDKVKWGDPDDIATCRSSGSKMRTWEDHLECWALFTFPWPLGRESTNSITGRVVSGSGGVAIEAAKAHGEGLQEHAEHPDQIWR